MRVRVRVLWFTPFRDIIDSIQYIVTSGHAQLGTYIVSSGHVISGQALFGSALFQVTLYMQFARKVGPSANLALIRYYSHRV